MKIDRIALLASTGMALAVWATPVWAQSADGTARPSTAEPPAVAQSEDIVVTAQKRAQTLIDVPQSVTVVSGATLETQQANTFQDYLKLVPGLQLNQDTPGQGRLILRGLNTGGVSSTVAVYQDESPFGSSSGLANGAVLAADFDTFDVARVEVLRGPQGTLYGANSLGGLIKFVTNLPETDKVVARARGGVESTEGGDVSYFGNAVLNFPLGSTLAIRASGFYRRNGGFVDSIGTGGSQVRNDVNGSRDYGGRASILFTPTPRISLQASVLLQNIETQAPTVEESDPVTLQTLHGGPTQSIFVTPFRDVSYRLYNGTANIGLGFADLTSSTSYSTQRQPSRTDETQVLSAALQSLFKVPNQLYLGQNTNLEKFTQELRLGSSRIPLFDWLLGGYYSHESALIFQQYYPVVPGTLDPVATIPLLAQVNLRSRYEEYAGFGNATVHLGNHFDIDLGGRYSHNDQSATQAVSGALVGAATSYTQDSSENVFTYSVAPKIKFGRNAAFYGRVAKGYRPGGPNALGPGAPVAARSYLSDSVVNYEVGFKGETANHTFGLDVDLFHIDWDRIQLLTTIQTTAGPFNYNGNGGRAKSDGAEFTATMRPTAGFDISVNGAITNARLTQDAPAASGFNGDKLPFVPRYSIGVNGDYRWTLTDAVHAFAGASLRFLSKQAGPFDATYKTTYGQRSTIPSYDVVDLRAGFDFGRLGVEAYVKNVGNSDGKTSVSSLGLYPAGAIATGVIRPRTVGLSVTASY